MPYLRRSLRPIAWLTLLMALPMGSAHANQLVYVSLDKPCRLLDTRASAGGSPLTAGGGAYGSGAYLFGASDADIESTAQHGSPNGCGIPSDATAVSVNMNLLNATASGNIATWSADVGTTAPNIGTAVYNPTAVSASSGQVQYNTGYTTIPLGDPTLSNPGRFYLQVANGQIDMTINAVGYWLSVSRGEQRGLHAIALGEYTEATGAYSTTMGTSTFASGYASTAIGDATAARGTYATATGYGTNADGDYSTAIGNRTNASGDESTAMGSYTTASGIFSTAMGHSTTASGYGSTAMGINASTNGHTGSFVYSDGISQTTVQNYADGQFMVKAQGGFVFFTNAATTAGVTLLPGSGSWTNLSDRNQKTAVVPVDGRDVLKKVVEMPLNTWQYKAQDAKYRHMGPMAQDFYAAFQLGESNTGIDTVDADGVALAAIQGLHAQLKDKEAEIASLRAEATAQAKDKDAQIIALHEELAEQKADLAKQKAKLAEQNADNAEQKKKVAALESLAGELADVKSQLAALRKSTPQSVTVALQP